MRACLASGDVLAQAAKYAADPDAPIEAYLSAKDVWEKPWNYAGAPRVRAPTPARAPSQAERDADAIRAGMERARGRDGRGNEGGAGGAALARAATRRADDGRGAARGPAGHGRGGGPRGPQAAPRRRRDRPVVPRGCGRPRANRDASRATRRHTRPCRVPGARVARDTAGLHTCARWSAGPTRRGRFHARAGAASCRAGAECPWRPAKAIDREHLGRRRSDRRQSRPPRQTRSG